MTFNSGTTPRPDPAHVEYLRTIAHANGLEFPDQNHMLMRHHCWSILELTINNAQSRRSDLKTILSLYEPDTLTIALAHVYAERSGVDLDTMTMTEDTLLDTYIMPQLEPFGDEVESDHNGVIRSLCESLGHVMHTLSSLYWVTSPSDCAKLVYDYLNE